MYKIEYGIGDGLTKFNEIIRTVVVKDRFAPDEIRTVVVKDRELIEHYVTTTQDTLAQAMKYWNDNGTNLMNKNMVI